MSEHLTLRNLTSTPITLKHIERFSDSSNAFSCLTSNLTRTLTSVTRTKDAVPIEPGSQPFAEKEVDIHVEPFKTVKTELRAFIESKRERLRLTIEAEGEKHQVQTPVPTTESATMKALCECARLKCRGSSGLEMGIRID